MSYFPGVSQNGAWGVAVTGDVLLRQLPSNTPIGTLSTPIGVQVLGGNMGGVQVQPSGDFQVRVGIIQAPIGISGDVLVRGGNAVAVKTDSSAVTQPVSFPGGVTIGAATAPIGVSGDVSTLPKAGQTWPVSIAASVPVTFSGQIGVQAVGGSFGGRVSISGDTLAVSQQGGWASSITGDVLLRANPNTVIGQLAGTLGVQIIGGGINRVSISGDQLNVSQQGVIGVQIVGGGVNRVSVSGDVLAVSQSGAWAVAVTGDVALRQNSTNTPIGTLSTAIGVNIVGGSIGARVSISGDTLAVSQNGAFATSVTGDVLLRQNATNTPIGTLSTPIGVQILGGAVGGQVSISGDVLLRQLASNTPIGTLSTPIGVNIIGGSIGGKFSSSGDTLNTSQQGVVGTQIVGGAIGGTVGVSGDVSVKPSTATNIGNFPVSGDQAIVDGTTRTTKATVRAYTRANPIAVALVNASGDDYAPVPKEPICQTIPFNVTTAGTTTIAGPYNGRVIKVCEYSLQGSSDIATFQGHFGSAASGSQLTPDWLLAVREGVTKEVSPLGGGYIFKTILNQALVLEVSAGSVRGSVTFHSGDSY